MLQLPGVEFRTKLVFFAARPWMWWWPLKPPCFMEPPGATPHSYGGWLLDELHNVSLGTMRVLWFEPLLSQGLRPALTYGQVYWMVCSYGIAGPGYQECEEGAWFIGYYKVRECFLSAKWSGLFVLFVLNLGQGSMTCDSSNCDNFEDKSPQIHLVMKPLVLKGHLNSVERLGLYLIIFHEKCPWNAFQVRLFTLFHLCLVNREEIVKVSWLSIPRVTFFVVVVQFIIR